ncbi:MAG: AMP-binding protein [Proteobacteria bacterium]|nr:AMP-binding protein [Pseudomonadota bacterium]
MSIQGDTYSEFVQKRPPRYNFARDVIDRWAALDPAKRAIRWTDGNKATMELTFADVSERSRRAADILRASGARRGDTVIVLLGRQLAWWDSITACLRGGIVVSPGTTQLSAKEIGQRIQAAGAVAIIADVATAAKVDGIFGACPTLKSRIIVGGRRAGWLSYEEEMARRENVASAEVTADTGLEDPALCYFTSGTTGLPKMVIHTHGYTLAHETTGRLWLDLTVQDLHWNISDTGWAKAAWSSYFGPWHQGASVFVLGAEQFEPEKTLAMLQEHPISTMCGAPTIYRMLVLQDLGQYHFPHLRHCVSAGEPLNPETINKWRASTGVTVRDGYGQTESVILCGSFPSMEVRLGSMGKPAPGFDLQIIDEHGDPLPVETEGAIAVRVRPEHPLGLFGGYTDAPDRNAACFRGDWYLTGDRGYRDTDGYFWFVGRGDDVIISAGYRIGPFEVESALIEHPAVAEAAVVSSPDNLRGEIVKAFVVLVPGASPGAELERELQDHVKSVTAPYKYPRRVEFVPSLPKTVSGKIRRVDLRNREWGR